MLAVGKHADDLPARAVARPPLHRNDALALILGVRQRAAARHHARTDQSDETDGHQRQCLKLRLARHELHDRHLQDQRVGSRLVDDLESLLRIVLECLDEARSACSRRADRRSSSTSSLFTFASVAISQMFSAIT